MGLAIYKKGTKFDDFQKSVHISPLYSGKLIQTVKTQMKCCYISSGPALFSSPEPKAQGELIVWDPSRRPSVRASVRASTLSNMNISETSWPIVIKFHLEHHRGSGLTA